MLRTASSHWTGNVAKGEGTLSTESGALSRIPYSFSTRFADTPGTNPEELIAAAHASCFTMALTAALQKKGFMPDLINVKAAVTLEKSGEIYSISSSRLQLRASVPGIDRPQFEAIAQEAKTGCPVSKVLDADISLEIDFHEGISSISVPNNLQ